MSDDTMTSDSSESGNLTVTEAASAIEGMLSAPEDSTQEQPEVVEEQTEEVAEVEEAEDQADYEEAVEATEDEVEEYADSEVEEPEEVEEEQTFTIKAAGEEKEVTLDELKKSYQLGSDYTKKTQEVAEQRKVIEQEAKAIIEARQVRDNYSQKLQRLEEFLSGQDDSPEDLAAMRENDPVGYAVKVADMTEKKEQLQKVHAERMQIAHEQKMQNDAQMKQFVQQEQNKLAESLPEFSDKAKGEQVRNDIRSYGKKIGFTDKELAQVYDAAQYRKLMAGKAGVKKKVAKAPKTLKSGAKVKQNVTDIQKKQLKRLQQTGSARDAAAIFENFI